MFFIYASISLEVALPANLTGTQNQPEEPGVQNWESERLNYR